MLKLVPNPTFAVNVHIPVAGEVEDKVVRAHFKFLKKEELANYLKSLEKRQDHEALSEIVVGWETKDGVTSDGQNYEGIDAEFTAENLQGLLGTYAMAAHSLFSAFRDESLKAKKGN